ncbi:MAG: FG-GAP and VCBS repeat-containing protein [Verrucomicrobiales bacterium]
MGRNASFIVCLAFTTVINPAVSTAEDLSAPRFEPQTIDDKISIGYGVAVADIDGDDKPDVVLADKKEIVWYQNPSWKKHLIARDLTLMDNVCVAARDIDGDNKAEIAVGAQWNPGETKDEAKSGAVFFLVRPDDLSQPWKPVKLTHEPTVHRMKWIRTGDNEFKLIVVPLHGRGNNPQSGEGEPVKVLAYDVPNDRTNSADWKTTVVDQSLHKTHNFDVRRRNEGPESLWLGGKEGVQQITYEKDGWRSVPLRYQGMDKGIGEVRGFSQDILAMIQPMHGNQVTLYHQDFNPVVLDESLNEGHALVCEALLGRGFPEVVAGWRQPDKEGKVGLKMYVRDDSSGKESWSTHLVADNTMACEDLVAADLNGDKKQDLVASGRATKNVVIYWNKTDLGPPISKERPELPSLTDEEKEKARKRKEAQKEKPKATD